MERRLFEVLGGWVPSTPEPEAKLLFDRHSRHHAWRAAQWWDRLPVLADVDRDALVAPPHAGVPDGIEALRSLGSTCDRLAGAYRAALPRVWAGYHRHRQSASAVSDPAALRTLAIVEVDLAADWREGECVLQDSFRGDASVEAAALAAVSVEKFLLSPPT